MPITRWGTPGRVPGVAVAVASRQREQVDDNHLMRTAGPVRPSGRGVGRGERGPGHLPARAV